MAVLGRSVSLVRRADQQPLTTDVRAELARIEQEFSALREEAETNAIPARTPAPATLPAVKRGPGLSSTSEVSTAGQRHDPLEYKLGLLDDESNLDRPDKARITVRYISKLTFDQQQELRERLDHYRPGSGDQVAAKISRMDTRVRLLVRKALALGPIGRAAEVVLDAELRSLEVDSYGRNVQVMVGVTPNAEAYLDRYANRLQFELARDGIEHLAPLHPQLTWTLSPDELQTRFEGALASAGRRYGDLRSLLVAILQPADVTEIVLRFLDEQQGLAACGLSVVPWRDAIANSFKPYLRSALQSSVGRIGLRFVAQADQHDELISTSIVTSTPADELVRELMCSPDAVIFRKRENGELEAGKQVGAFAKGLRAASILPANADDPRIWNWVQVTNLPDATPEEVAATLFQDRGGAHSERAYGIVSLPPYFAVPARWACCLPFLARNAPKAALDAAKNTTIEESDRASRLAFASAPEAKEVVPSRALADSSGPVRATVSPDELALVSLRRLDDIRQLVDARMADKTKPAIGEFGANLLALLQPSYDWLTSLRGRSNVEVALHANALADQRDVLSSAVPGFRSLVVSAKCGVKIIDSALADYACAIGTSHLPQLAAGPLARATQSASRVSLALLEESVRASRSTATDVDAETVMTGGTSEAGQRQFDLEERVVELGQDPTYLDPDKVADLVVDAQASTLANKMFVIRDKSRHVVRALNDSNDGIVGALANITRNGDIADYKSFFGQLADWVEGIDDKLRMDVSAIETFARDTKMPLVLRREAIANCVAAARNKFEALTNQPQVRHWLQSAADLAESAKQRSECARVILTIVGMVAATLVLNVGASALGGAVEGLLLPEVAEATVGFARMAQVASMTGTAVTVGAEALGGAAVQNAVNGDSMGASFIENLAANVLTSFAMAPIRAAVTEIAATEKGLVALWKTGEQGLALAKGLSAFSLEFMVNMSVSMTTARFVRGEQPATGWMPLLENGVAMAAGHLVSHRLTDLSQRAREYGARGAQLWKRARTQRTFAESIAERGGDLESQLKLLTEYNGALQEERDLLFASGGQAALGLTDAQLATLRAGNASSVEHKNLQAAPLVNLYLQGLRPASDDGIEWSGSLEKIQLGLASAGGKNTRRRGNVVKSVVDGVERSFYVIDNEHGADAFQQLTDVGADVTPLNTDPTRNQWGVKIGETDFAIQENPRTSRPSESVPASTTRDLEIAHRRAEAQRAAFLARQRNVQSALEALPYVWSRHLQIGLGPAGVLHQSLQAPELAALGIGERLIITRDFTSVLETRGDQPIGQHRGEIDSPGIPVAEHSLASKEGEFVTSNELSNAMADGRMSLQANVLEGSAVSFERRETARDWDIDEAPFRVLVKTASGKTVRIYADVIDDLTGPGTPKDAPLRTITDQKAFNAGTTDNTILAGADLDLLEKLLPGSRVLSIPGSASSDWAAEASARLGPDGHVDLVGDVRPTDRAKYKAMLDAAIASRDPVRISQTVFEIEAAAHGGLDIPRNRMPGSAGDNAQISRRTGRPTNIERLSNGRYAVTFESIVGGARDVQVYDQIIYSYGQGKSADLTARFGEGAKGDDEVPSGTTQFEMVMHDGKYVGLKMVGGDYYIPGPAASRDYAGWIAKSQRKAWLEASEHVADAGTATRDHGPISRDSNGVNDGLEAQRDRLGLANEQRALRSFRLPGTSIELHLGTDENLWGSELLAFFQDQLPATPREKIRLEQKGEGRSRDLVFEVFTADHSLGIVKLFRDGASARTEARLLTMLEEAKLTRLQVVRGRGRMTVDANNDGKSQSLLMDSAPGRSINEMVKSLSGDPAKRAQQLEELNYAVRSVAEGLAELHAKFRDTLVSEADARAARASDANYFLEKLMRADIVPTLGGHANAEKIANALRARLLDKFLDANLPASAYHGDANVGNFKVDGVDADHERFNIVSTYDVGTMQYGFPQGTVANGTATKGIKPAAAADAARFLSTLEIALSEKGSRSEFSRLNAAFEKAYKAAWKDNQKEAIDMVGWKDAEAWYRIELDVAAAKNDPQALKRIERALEIELGQRGRTNEDAQ
ncbi:MAG TPA: phosphotransferase [Kofleriaceae bacterium]